MIRISITAADIARGKRRSARDSLEMQAVNDSTPAKCPGCAARCRIESQVVAGRVKCGLFTACLGSRGFGKTHPNYRHSRP